MTTTPQTTIPDPAVDPDGGEDEAPATAGRNPFVLALRVLAAVSVVALIVFGRDLLDFLADPNANRLTVAAVAIVLGVGGIFLLFWAMDTVVGLFPQRWATRLRPYVFVGPALAILGVFLIYPVVNTVIISFRNNISEGFVGLENYRFVFTDSSMLRSLRNTAGWVFFVPLVAVSIGLAFATLADRLRRGEAVAKSLIFLPMAISFVGAAATFRLIYSFRPEGFGENIGLLNGIRDALGMDPIAWMSQQPWNNLLLMAIMVWMQTGFAMVVLSAAIKSIPDEIVEAARIDGASEWQVFRHILIPSIRPTIAVVTTYMVINALKVFDLVFVMGNAEVDGTEVVAERMIQWFFLRDNDGRGAAVAVVLFLAIIPVMLWNVKRFREQEAIR